ncbi:epoxide hydrolase 3-like [Uranotaenia lowii]|uniref:epoxide hydrolase 3-like n=1 Tax=Uranotaenia lowii TaxID=190385 RepID=UPI00247AC6BB|nr:epoxide hydrolase 3-like [Uranotaenia lowii]
MIGAVANSVLRAVQSVAVYAISGVYTAGFVVKTALEFRADPTPENWTTKVRKVPPAVLNDPAYGRHKFIEVNGVKLHYVENGDREKPLMLFLHGFPEFWFSWRHQLKEFSREYWTVALDLRGYGQSEPLNERSAYQLDIIIEDVRAFVEAMGKEKVILVGHDWGAVLGFQFVSKHMEMVDRYIMMGAPSLDVIRRLLITSWEQFRKSWYTFFFQMPDVPEFYIRNRDFRYIEENMGKFLTHQELEAFKYTFTEKNALTRAIDYYRENFSFLRKEEKLPEIKEYSPGLYIVAENDQFISFRSGPLMVKSFPRLQYRIVPNSEHYVQQEHPSIVNQMIREFLN